MSYNEPSVWDVSSVWYAQTKPGFVCAWSVSGFVVRMLVWGLGFRVLFVHALFRVWGFPFFCATITRSEL